MDGTVTPSYPASANDLRQLADTLGLGFVHVTHTGDIQSSNAAFATLIGAGGVGAPPEFQLPDSVRAGSAGSDKSIRAKLLRMDGREIAIRADIVLEGPSGDRAIFIRRIGKDAAPEGTEQKLKETIRRFDILTDRSGMGMWLAGPDNLILEANHAMARLMKLASVNPIIGKDAFAFTPPDERLRLQNSLANLAPDGAASIRHALIQANGAVIRVQSDMTRDPATGGCITFVRDVTEEEQLVRDLAGRNQDLEHFSIAASHDLREPMRKIATYAGMLEEDLTDVMSDAARKDLAVISDAAKRMSTLVEMLSVYVNLKESIHAPQLVALEPLIDDIAHELDMPDDVHLLVNAPEPLLIDKSALQRLCRAMLSNCIIYRRQGVPLTIQAKAQWKSPGVMLLSFEDNGEGIPQEQRLEVIRPLKRLRTQGISPGAGMGLAICARIAEYYGGSLEIGASSSGGTDVKIELRLTKPSLQTAFTA